VLYNSGIRLHAAAVLYNSGIPTIDNREDHSCHHSYHWIYGYFRLAETAMTSLKELCIRTLKPYGSKDLALKKTMTRLRLLPTRPIPQCYPEMDHRKCKELEEFARIISYSIPLGYTTTLATELCLRIARMYKDTSAYYRYLLIDEAILHYNAFHVWRGIVNSGIRYT